MSRRSGEGAYRGISSANVRWLRAKSCSSSDASVAIFTCRRGRGFVTRCVRLFADEAFELAVLAQRREQRIGGGFAFQIRLPPDGFLERRQRVPRFAGLRVALR